MLDIRGFRNSVQKNLTLYTPVILGMIKEPYTNINIRKTN